jgi:MOSC domain-containing protein YiiM
LAVTPHVVAVSASPEHAFSKPNRDRIRLLEGLGVEGDAHAGVTVQHLSRIARDPTQPNLRQVHLLHGELLADLLARGIAVAPGAIGENVTTQGVDLHALPLGTRLRLGASAVIELTGLRNPCAQLNGIAPGLLGEVSWRDAAGNVVRRAGVMSVVVKEGVVQAGDPIAVELPAAPHVPLDVV